MANSGLCRSKDGGNYWSAENTGLLSQDGEITILDSTLIVSYHSGGVYRSSDSGINWQNINKDLGRDSNTIREFAASGHIIAIGPWGSPSTGYIYLSTNDGVNWMNFGSVHRFNGLGLIEGYAVAAGAFGTARRSLLDTLALSGVGAVSAFSANIQTFPTPFSQATTITFTPETSGYAD